MISQNTSLLDDAGEPAAQIEDHCPGPKLRGSVIALDVVGDEEYYVELGESNLDDDARPPRWRLIGLASVAVCGIEFTQMSFPQRGVNFLVFREQQLWQLWLS